METSNDVKIPQFKESRVLHWAGGVGDKEMEKFSAGMGKLSLDGLTPALLLLSNFGGSCSLGFGFYDLVRFVLKPKLYSLVVGSAESMGVILYLSATEKRIMTPNSSLFLHEVGWKLEASRYKDSELNNLRRNTQEWQNKYAIILAENSGGKITVEQAVKMMCEEKRIFPEEAMELGLCDHILGK